MSTFPARLFGPTLARQLPSFDRAGSSERLAIRQFAELTGSPTGGARHPTGGFVDAVANVGSVLATLTGRRFDPFEALIQRARFQSELVRRGQQSCSGSTRLLASSDGTVALSLARQSDVDMLGAVFDEVLDWPADAGVTDELWSLVAARLSMQPSAYWTDRARILGVPLVSLGEERSPTTGQPALRTTAFGTRTLRRTPLIVDLSSLWAGPLCSRLLADAGAHVVKIDDVHRPDGARRGSPELFQELHAGKEFVQIDFSSADGVSELRERILAADVVIEASRPRSLRNLGLSPERLMPQSSVAVWLSITGFGRTGPNENRVAFGDDAAVAGGLVSRGSPTTFLGDAVADPLTGMVAACAVLQTLAGSRRYLVDVGMARVAASFAGVDR